MMNSSRANPTPSLGMAESENASSGDADIHHDLCLRSLQIRQVDRLDLERQRAFVDDTGISLGATDRDLLPVLSSFGCIAAFPRSRAIPSSRLTMAA